MAYLINRNVSGRLPCLHGICQYLKAQFGDSTFSIQDLKYDENKEFNIHDYSPCAKKLNNSDYITCRYLQNPLSEARCALVQSVSYDPQKSKLASDIMNALDGLGLVDRVSGSAKLTSFGKKFAGIDRGTPEWSQYARKAVLNYGPFVGLLNTAGLVAVDKKFSRSQLDKIGYPTTNETIVKSGRSIALSSGSQADTMTRTRSILVTYGVTTGFFKSDQISDPIEYAMSDRWNVNSFRLDTSLMPDKPYVSKPLSYTTLTKSTRSLRERGQEVVRVATMKAEHIINNRRLAIIFLINEASKDGKKVNYSKLCEMLKQHNQFVVNHDEFDAVMAKEIKIVNIAGLAIKVEGDIVVPKSTINEKILVEGAEKEIIELLNDIKNRRSEYEQ